MRVLQQVKADFDSMAKVEHQPKMEGRQRVMAPAPK